ncbi:hypothetical protein CQW23_10853 [Capsicum baccatum]|uniref:Cytochrome n=1 Tax=Capsicum baccatum TaxID=33114 RepID=A0A2G2X0T5_CAPBA|nr:hypothetical protein CQW23_10853 [Capsicum baccatum]
MLRHIREFEVKTSIKTMYKRWSKEMMNDSQNIVKIDMKQWFENLIMTIIVRMLFGKEHDLGGGKRARKAIRKTFKLFGTFIIADFIPSLRWLDIGGYEKEMKENAKETDCILEKWLVEHKRKISCGELKNEDEKDFMDIMLSLFEGARDEDLPGFDADTIIKSTCLAMLAGGTDSTVVALTWTISLLLNNPHVMQKALEELDIQVGRNTLVNEYSSTIQLVEDSTGSDRLVRTPLYKPERFLTTHKEVDIKGNHFELIPFGAGRRLCPGISSALVLLLLTLANVLHAFEITRPSDESIDMT